MKKLKYIGISIFLIGFIFLQVYTDLSLPTLMADIIDRGVLHSNQAVVYSIGLDMLRFAGIGIVASVIVVFCASQLSTMIGRDIRNRFFAKIQTFSLLEMSRLSNASLLRRTTQDINFLQEFLFVALRVCLIAPLTAIYAIYLVFERNVSILPILLISCLVIVLVIISFYVLTYSKFSLLQKLSDRLNLIAKETILGIRVVQANNKEQYQEDKFQRTNQALQKTTLFLERVMVLLNPFLLLCLNLTIVVLLWFGSKQVQVGMLEVGQLMAFIQYVTQFVTALLMMSSLLVAFPEVMVSISRLREVFQMKVQVQDRYNPVKYRNRMKGQLEFQNVSFQYPNADFPVLHQLSFSVKRGETVAIVGPTGAGKTTLLHMIPRLLDPSSGSILINDVDLRDMQQEMLRKQIGYVPQKSILFEGTIEQNVKYGGKRVSTQAMNRALKLADANCFVNKRKKKSHDEVVRGGKNFSGGQQQRLSIARALVRDADIYLFDDCFSAMDFKTEQKILEQLQELFEHKITLIVSSRIRTVQYMDRILVLDNGKIVGDSTHQQLLKTCPVYQELVQSQIDEGE